ncbi:hypothetical protein NE237_021480 [Protea cynaroides]|uniref:Uncharacterized protein n=1 Tax=Protea cynaroides TaxID=273540 RepID=A0A9Q0HBC8_9MAGN|nr:hypothetical protein NE237_021480 [Protea cynaroides]
MWVRRLVGRVARERSGGGEAEGRDQWIRCWQEIEEGFPGGRDRHQRRRHWLCEAGGRPTSLSLSESKPFPWTAGKIINVVSNPLNQPWKERGDRGVRGQILEEVEHWTDQIKYFIFLHLPSRTMHDAWSNRIDLS